MTLVSAINLVMLKLSIMKIIFIALCISLISCQKEYPIADTGNAEEAARLSGNNVFSLRTNDVPETQPLTYVPITLSISENCGGFWRGLPAIYNSTTKKYPLLIHLTGESKLGDGSAADLATIASPLHSSLKNKSFPPNFVSGGKNFSFIVISPQFKVWPTANDINEIVNYFTSTLRIDKTRIYVSGLSMGGGVTWDYGAKYASKVAAIVPVCGSHTPTQTKAKIIASANLPVWAFHNELDPRVPVVKTIDFVNMINKFHPGIAAKMTIDPSETLGHNAWDKAFSQTYKENNMNIYQWMLQYHR